MKSVIITQSELIKLACLLAPFGFKAAPADDLDVKAGKGAQRIKAIFDDIEGQGFAIVEVNGQTIVITLNTGDLPEPSPLWRIEVEGAPIPFVVGYDEPIGLGAALQDAANTWGLTEINSITTNN